MQSPATQSRQHQDGFIGRLVLAIAVIVFACIVSVRTWIRPPADFPLKCTVAVADGEDVGTLAYQLQQAHIVRSAEAFKLLMLALGSEQRVSVGSYYFDAPVTVIEVALKFSGRTFGILQHRVTFPEGFTNAEIAARMAARFPGFDEAAFLALAKNQQGYLFPDTYGFEPNIAPQSVIDTMQRTFIQKTASLAADFTQSKRSKADIIIMASILEKEAANAAEMPTIAGILWKRIDRGLELQVDAPLAVLLGKTSAQLTVTDLASSSPYNTYTHTGLPPAPIDNPGFAAITAALHPVDSPYLYYLHDANGNIHYASTFEAHKQNIQHYLK